MIKIANYLITHYKSKYRILCDVCENTNDFPKKLDGTYEDIDCYISCEKDIRIYSYGHGVLEAYIPSVKSGRNILRLFYRDNINADNVSTTINEYIITKNDKEINATKEKISIIDEKLFMDELENSNLIFDIVETDSELTFKFKASNMELFKKYLKPRTYGANISPFSNKNRPKSKYIIPTEDQMTYDNIIKNLDKDKMVFVAHKTKSYLQSLVNKKNPWDKIKADIIKSGLKNTHYIHSIGKWNDYIKFLENELCR